MLSFKKLSLIFGFFLLTCAQAEVAGNHKMLLWGGEKLYLSHWAMFHGSHKRQVLIEVEMNAAEKALYLESQRASPNEFFSINPDNFHLGAYMETPHDLIAEVYLGHAERGGEVIEGLERVTFRTKKILFKRDFVATDSHPLTPEVARYILIGAGDGKYYLAHKIKAKSNDPTKPEFDKVLEVSFQPELKESIDAKLLEESSIEIEIANQANLDPLEVNDERIAKSSKIVGDIQLKVLKGIYFETSDFEM